MKKYFSVLIFVFLIACNSNKNVEKDRINITVKEANSYEDFLQDYSIIKVIPLETKKESMIGKISELYFYKDRIFVLDNRYTDGLFCFTNDGKFKFKYGKVGRGPGEYKQPTCSWISNNGSDDRIAIHDGFLRRNMYYTLEDGKYIEDKPTGNGIYLECEQVGANLICSQSYHGLEDEDRLMIINSSTLDVDFLGLKSKSDFDLFQTDGSISKAFNNQHVLFTTGFEGVIYQISGDGILKEYFVDFGKKAIPEEMKESFDFDDFDMAQLRTDIAGKYFFWISNLCETEEDILFSYTDFKIRRFSSFNKRTAECNSYRMPDIGDNQSFNYFPLPLTTIGNDTLISCIGPQSVAEYNKYKKIFNLEVTENDNPIIIMYKKNE